ncbi:glycosyl hydrolase family 61 [Drepanopeziza brunnea f. sp. 'multigermtubi' MB_m1]|uniref:Glycosyl hydrolase family 61 n=1 Tax=Marssonina brunnea f. sp. multigermtubi (strain MB_m1) TaxID=1072389 RepID=K1X8V2_MARBU|nr:glycosyl hydrolase family 61 [Drepanopeziza brunnea f. sp. 'multigermtubi' MB_m1]EKD17128.1 glycosyl hydrolase family 61 [Drepanopeziza brunnea f. sp. 'multigermtubi' MB_m1]
MLVHRSSRLYPGSNAGPSPEAVPVGPTESTRPRPQRNAFLLHDSLCGVERGVLAVFGGGWLQVVTVKFQSTIPIASALSLTFAHSIFVPLGAGGVTNRTASLPFLLGGNGFLADPNQPSATAFELQATTASPITDVRSNDIACHGGPNPSMSSSKIIHVKAGETVKAILETRVDKIDARHKVRQHANSKQRTPDAKRDLSWLAYVKRVTDATVDVGPPTPESSSISTRPGRATVWWEWLDGPNRVCEWKLHDQQRVGITASVCRQSRAPPVHVTIQMQYLGLPTTYVVVKGSRDAQCFAAPGTGTYLLYRRTRDADVRRLSARFHPRPVGRLDLLPVMIIHPG